MKIIDELYKKYGIKDEDAEKREKQKEEILKEDNTNERGEKQKTKEEVVDVFQLFCKDKEAKNLKE